MRSVANETPATVVLQAFAASSARSSTAGSDDSTEDLVPVEGLDPQGFTARNFAFFQCGDHLTPRW